MAPRPRSSINRHRWHYRRLAVLGAYGATLPITLTNEATMSAKELAYELVSLTAIGSFVFVMVFWLYLLVG